MMVVVLKLNNNVCHIEIIHFLHQNSPPYSGYSWLKWAGFCI